MTVLSRAARYFGIGLGDLVDVELDVPEVEPSMQEIVTAWPKLSTAQRRLLKGMVAEMALQTDDV